MGFNQNHSLLFDAENRLISIDTPTSMITYAYDPRGRRIEKNVDGTTIRYIYDGEYILLELDDSNIIRARYTHGPGIDEPLVMERDTNLDGTLEQRVYYHADGLGSIKTLTNDTGTIVQTYLYDSFGNTVEQTGIVNNPYTYTGREYDVESGLYYYRARYYDARIGRFLSEDPIGHIVGVNLYIFVKNNPISFTDPTGQFPVGWVIGGIIAIEAIRTAWAWDDVQQWSRQADKMFGEDDKAKHRWVSEQITNNYGPDVALAYGLGKEILDSLDPDHTASWEDLLADLEGILEGICNYF